MVFYSCSQTLSSISLNSNITSKNVIPFPYGMMSQVVNGITWTVNEDGSVTADGTATSNSNFWLVLAESPITLSGSYKLTGCPSGGGNAVYSVRLTNTSASTIMYDTGSGKTGTLSGEYAVICQVASGQTVSDITFYPMLRLSSDTDDTYAPYFGTNEELTLRPALTNNISAWSNAKSSGDTIRLYDLNFYNWIGVLSGSAGYGYYSTIFPTKVFSNSSNILTVDGSDSSGDAVPITFHYDGTDSLVIDSASSCSYGIRQLFGLF